MYDWAVSEMATNRCLAMLWVVSIQIITYYTFWCKFIILKLSGKYPPFSYNMINSKDSSACVRPCTTSYWEVALRAFYILKTLLTTNLQGRI